MRKTSRNGRRAVASTAPNSETVGELTYVTGGTMIAVGCMLATRSVIFAGAALILARLVVDYQAAKAADAADQFAEFTHDDDDTPVSFPLRKRGS